MPKRTTTPTTHAFVPNDSLPPDLDFAPRKRIPSPYDAALIELRDEKPASVICYASAACHNSLKLRSKKLGIKLHFAEHSGMLYVRLAEHKAERPLANPLNTDDDLIMEAIRNGALTPATIAISVEKKRGKKLRPISEVEPRLNDLIRKRLIRLKTRRAQDTEDRYELMPDQKLHF